MTDWNHKTIELIADVAQNCAKDETIPAAARASFERTHSLATARSQLSVEHRTVPFEDVRLDLCAACREAALHSDCNNLPLGIFACLLVRNQIAA